MTVQINDKVFHRNIEFAIAGVSGFGLLDRSTLGFEPVGRSSNCWRGYVAGYSILDGELLLTSLFVGLPKEADLRAKACKSLELFGVVPGSVSGVYEGFYEGFRVPIPFTGGLLLADGFVRERWVHSGSDTAWTCERVREVICDAGHITGDHDRSTEMADIRGKIFDDMMRSKGDSSGPMRYSIAPWVAECAKCFLCDYPNGWH